MKLLKDLREKRKLSKAQVAKALAVDPKVYSRWENGKGMPTVLNLSRLSVFFKVKIEKLISSSQEAPQTNGPQ